MISFQEKHKIQQTRIGYFYFMAFGVITLAAVLGFGLFIKAAFGAIITQQTNDLTLSEGIGNFAYQMFDNWDATTTISAVSFKYRVNSSTDYIPANMKLKVKAAGGTQSCNSGTFAVLAIATLYDIVTYDGGSFFEHSITGVFNTEVSNGYDYVCVQIEMSGGANYWQMRGASTNVNADTRSQCSTSGDFNDPCGTTPDFYYLMSSGTYLIWQSPSAETQIPSNTFDASAFSSVGADIAPIIIWRFTEDTAEPIKPYWEFGNFTAPENGVATTSVTLPAGNYNGRVYLTYGFGVIAEDSIENIAVVSAESEPIPPTGYDDDELVFASIISTSSADSLAKYAVLWRSVFPLSVFFTFKDAIDAAQATTTDVIAIIETPLLPNFSWEYLSSSTLAWVSGAAGFDYRVVTDYILYMATGYLILMGTVTALTAAVGYSSTGFNDF